MFEEAFDNLRKVTDVAFWTQQEMLKKCIGLWPVVPFPAGLGVARKYRKESLEIIGELLKKQRESAEAQFSESLRTVEEIFHLSEVEDPEEFRTKVVDIWQKSYDSLRHLYEARVNDFLTAVAKEVELVTRAPTPHVAA